MQTRLDRYFEAFEMSAMKPELCNQKVEDLTTRQGELDAEKYELEARRERLDMPAIDKEMLSSLL